MSGLAVPVRAADRAVEQPTVPPHVLVLVAAVSAGVVAQGGYYVAGRALVTVLVAVALAVALWASPVRRADFGPVPLAAGALALWVLVRAVQVHWYPEAVAAVATLGCLAAVPLVLARTGTPAREQTAQLAVWLGTAVAATAWIGVAWRVPRFAVLVEHRLWRGASTLTYPNAAAALLVPLALLAIALLVDRPGPVRALAAYLLLVGVGAALSRAGFLALPAGLVVLALLAGVRATVREAAPLVVGAAVAVAALVPSVPATARPQPLLAVAGLLAGAVMALGPGLLPPLARRIAVALLVGSAAAVAVVAGRSPSGRLAQVLASRGNLDSSGRTGALHVAWQMIRERPVAGTGVGVARFIWDTPDGNGAVALYAHNEYVQTVVDLGAVGAVLLLALLAAIAVHLYRGRGLTPASRVRAGALAALTAFAVHSGFDFLWHIAVLPVVAGLLIGLAGPAMGKETGKETSKARQSHTPSWGRNMKAHGMRFAAVAAATVGLGAALAFALPAGAAVSLQSQSPPVGAVQLAKKATLDANGAVVFAPVKVTCPPNTSAFLRVKVTENVGDAIASGETDESIDLCTGTVQQESVAVTPVQKPFKKGVAFGQAWLEACNQFTCKTSHDFHNIEIVKK